MLTTYRHSEPAPVQGHAWIGSSMGRGATLAPTQMTRERPAAVHREANSGEGQAATLDGAFRGRVRQSPDAVAYVQFDPATRRWQEATWAETAREVARWQVGLGTLGLCPGDRVAVMLGNGPDWVAFDQAALGLGLVTVPLYPGDRPDNVDWVLRDSGSRALLIEGREQWRVLQPIALTLSRLEAVISRRGIPADAPNLRHAASWLPDSGPTLAPSRNHPDDLATLVYTSGTTGRPKGVMLSHGNILANVRAGLASVEVEPNDCFLSFLPLSHMLERTIGYYLPLVAGCRVAYARSIADLADDMIQVRPTILVSVPRVFERVQARIQETLAAAPPLKRWLLDLALTLGWRRHLHSRGRAPWSPGLLVQPVLDALAGAPVRARLGGRLRFAISGGAPLPEAVGRFFIALGVEILQGYGLTETSPVISVNRPGDNEPGSVGPPLPGVQIRIGADDELLARGPSVMQGYWHDPDTTRALIDAAGWLHTGDQARIGPRGHITITGRLKDVLVLSTGEKVSPADIEQALVASPLVEQVMVIGDGRPYLSALVVPKPQVLARMAATLGLAGATADEDLRRHPAIERDLLGRLQPHLSAFPGYAKLVRLALAEAPWTLENGLMTPTLKLKRREILRRYAGDLERLYVGH